MPYIKIKALALPVVSSILLAGSAANAADSARGHYVTFWGGSQYSASEAVTANVRAHDARGPRVKLRDNNAPTASLSAREFFDRISGRSR